MVLYQEQNIRQLSTVLRLQTNIQQRKVSNRGKTVAPDVKCELVQVHIQVTSRLPRTAQKRWLWKWDSKCGREAASFPCWGGLWSSQGGKAWTWESRKPWDHTAGGGGEGGGLKIVGQDTRGEEEQGHGRTRSLCWIQECSGNQWGHVEKTLEWCCMGWEARGERGFGQQRPEEKWGAPCVTTGSERRRLQTSRQD